MIPKAWLSIAIEGGLRQRCCRLEHIVWFKTVEKNESTVRLEGFALFNILVIMVCFIVEYDYDYDSFCFSAFAMLHLSIDAGQRQSEPL